METENTTQAVPAAGSGNPPKKCENPSCGKEFIPKTVRAKYCCQSCNAKASQYRAAQGTSVGVPFVAPPPASSTASVPGMNGLSGLAGLYFIPPHAQMMIDHHRGEAARWENLYNEARAEHKAAKQQVDDLKEESRSKEKGLNGFLESSAGTEIVKAFAPVLAGLAASRLPQGGQQLAITDGAGGQMAAHFGQWISRLSETGQQTVWSLITHLSNTDEEAMNYKIQHILQQWQVQQ